MKRILKLLLLSIAIFPALLWTTAYKDFVILIASHNNEAYAQQNILSAIQNYPEEHYRIIFIDDCSQDKTLSVVENVITHLKKWNLITIFHNTEQMGALHNHYCAINDYIKDEEIVVILDGDDQLAHKHALTYLNSIYSRADVWLTYGQFKHTSNGDIGFNCPMPTEVVQNNAFRSWQHIPSHLRTFYAKLYKNIKIEDLTINGNFFPMCADMATMIPMIEQARDHFIFIPNVLYLYNDENPISDHLKDKNLQRKIDLYVRSLPTYQPLEKLF